MIVDSSAVCALLLEEPGHEVVANKLVASPVKRMSSASVVEVATVMMARSSGRPRAEVAADAIASIERLGIAIEPVDARAAALAAAVYASHGRGAGTAGLNLGDVFVAALALERGEPILAAGTDEFLRAGLPQVT
jgi:ribonuclease VapC